MAVILNYKTQKQILDDWCWAAVASSVSFNYRPTGGLTQSALAGTLIDQSCLVVTAGSPETAPDICNQVFDLEQALIRTRNLGHTFNGFLAFTALCAEIDQGRPVCCQIFWPERDKSHYITLYGYIGHKIVIGDPEKNAGVCSLDYGVLVQSYRTGQWKRSFFTQPPK